MRLGFIILAHDRPDSIRRLCSTLTAAGDRVVIHFDAGSPEEDKAAVREIAAENPEQVRMISKVRCRWGEWSLVDAVLHAMREFAAMPEKPDFIHLMSAADFPLRPLEDFRDFLRRHPQRDFIECCDISRRKWVKGGLGRERFRLFFPFNYRRSRKAFDRMVALQKFLRIRRRIPKGLSPHMGSQWWTMRWSTCAKLLDFIKARPGIVRYFRRTWIPDESFVQTLVAKLVPPHEIANLQLTFHHLTPTGRPYVFYNDHLPLLKRIPHFFVRKVSPQAADLWQAELEKRAPGMRIPTEKRLAKVRDLLRSRIDSNYLVTAMVPGYTPDPKEPLVFPITRPALIFLVDDHALLDECERIARATPGACWLGRPFALKNVAMPEEALVSIGMTAASWKLRDEFPADFLRQLLESQPAEVLPVAAIWIGRDEPDLEALAHFTGLMPLHVTDGELPPHRASQVAGHFHDRSPAFRARIVNVDRRRLAAAISAARMSRL
jgi:hypothetical protein